MRPPRPVAMIRHELDAALAYQSAYRDHPTTDALAQQMRDDNDRDIARLRAELTQALAGDLEITLEGRPVAEHRIELPYFNRVTESFQAAYRAVFRSIAPDQGRRNETTLAISATGAGSFKVSLAAPPTQLELLDAPIIDRAMGVIVDLFQRAGGPETFAAAAAEWAARADESEVRAMIRLSSSLAASQGTTRIRWRGAASPERLVEVRAEHARDLAAALAGQAGREIVTVTGHLQMAQDEPPRVRIRTAGDEHLAKIASDELLDLVKSLLFDEVRATLVIDMRTSPTLGSPTTIVELIDLEPA